MLVCKLFSIWWEGEGRTSSKMFRMQFLSCRGTRRRIRPYSVCVVVGREKRCTLSGRELKLLSFRIINIFSPSLQFLSIVSVSYLLSCKEERVLARFERDLLLQLLLYSLKGEN